MAFLSDILFYGGLGLQVAALILITIGPLSRYFPLFLYLLSVVCITASELWLYRTVGVGSSVYFNVFWGGEILLDVLLFFLVISLTTRALEGHPARSKTVTFMAGILALSLFLPFVAFQSAVFGRHWNQSVAQLFNFGAALMNLALWSALVVGKRRDRQLLTVSAGLGVTVAGAALSLGVRQFTGQGDALRVVADYVFRMSQVCGPLIWCWAFWPKKRIKTPPPLQMNVPVFKPPTRAAG